MNARRFSQDFLSQSAKRVFNYIDDNSLEEVQEEKSRDKSTICESYSKYELPESALVQFQRQRF